MEPRIRHRWTYLQKWNRVPDIKNGLSVAKGYQIGESEEWVLLNGGVGEDSWESLGLQGDPTSPSSRRPALNIHGKDWCWSWNCNNLATWCKELTHLERPWCWERLKAGGEGDSRGWDWMSSPTWWTWVWANYRSWTGGPGVLVHGVAETRTWLSDGTELMFMTKSLCSIPEINTAL